MTCPFPVKERVSASRFLQRRYHRLMVGRKGVPPKKIVLGPRLAAAVLEEYCKRQDRLFGNLVPYGFSVSDIRFQDIPLERATA